MSKEPKVVGGINLTTKVKSKGFWVATIPVVATFVTSILSLLGVNVAEDVINQYTAIAGVVISLLAQFGILVDFNTKGVADSPIAQTYTAPRDAYNPDEHVVYANDTNAQVNKVEKELGVLQPKEYDTSQPFTDNSDTIPFEDEVSKDPSVQVPSDKPLGSTAVENVDDSKNTPMNQGNQTPKSEGGQK